MPQVAGQIGINHGPGSDRRVNVSYWGSLSDASEPGSLKEQEAEAHTASVMDGGVAVTHNGHLMCGWMDKKGGMRKNWLKRWFKFNDAQQKLEYYDSVAKRVPLGVIDLATCTEARQSRRPGAVRVELELVCAERTWVLRAPSEHAFKTWLSAIQKQIAAYAAPEVVEQEEGGLRDEEGFKMSTNGSYDAAVGTELGGEDASGAAAAQPALRPRPGAPNGNGAGKRRPGVPAPVVETTIAPKAGKPVPRLRSK